MESGPKWWKVAQNDGSRPEISQGGPKWREMIANDQHPNEWDLAKTKRREKWLNLNEGIFRVNTFRFRWRKFSRKNILCKSNFNEKNKRERETNAKAKRGGTLKQRLWAVVMAQLVEQSLPTPEVRGSKPAIIHLLHRTLTVLRRLRKRAREWPIFYTL